MSVLNVGQVLLFFVMVFVLGVGDLLISDPLLYCKLMPHRLV